MIKGMLGKKIGMSQVFSEEGVLMPVTIIKVGPCSVVQKKSKEKDGYDALQIGFEEKKESRVNKPLNGHFKKYNSIPHYHLREFGVDKLDEYQSGQKVTAADVFKVGDIVNIAGISKGKGFAGVMKRWNFRGGPGGHGSMFNRAPGSVGASAYPSRVFKGRKLPGHYGSARVTVKNLTVVDLRPEDDIVMIKGAVPGAPNSIVELYKA